MIEGLTATVLLVVGGGKSLTALQTMAIATGVIYSGLVCGARLALWRALQVQVGDLDPSSPGFDVHILDPFFTDPLDEVLSKITLTSKLFIKFLINLVFAPLSVAKTSSIVISASSFWPVLLSLSIFFFFFVFLHFLQLIV